MIGTPSKSGDVDGDIGRKSLIDEMGEGVEMEWGNQAIESEMRVRLVDGKYTV